MMAFLSVQGKKKATIVSLWQQHLQPTFLDWSVKSCLGDTTAYSQWRLVRHFRGCRSTQMSVKLMAGDVCAVDSWHIPCHWISATWLYLSKAAQRISQEEWWDVQGENQLLSGRPFILQSLIHTAVAFSADILLSVASCGPQEPWVEGWESHANLISSRAELATFPKLFSSA